MTIKLEVKKDLEPQWYVVNNRQEPLRISATDRARLNVFMVSDYIDRHFSWSRGNPLYSILKENQSSGDENSDVIIEAFREAKGKIDQDSFNQFNDVTERDVLQIKESDKYTSGSNYNKKVWELTKEDNVLIIHPDSSNLNVRKKFTSQFNNAFVLVEAIDNNDFYEFSRRFDNIDSNNVYDIIYNLIPDLFNGTTSRNKWFDNKGIKRKKTEGDRGIIEPIQEDIKRIRLKISLSVISRILRKIKSLPDMKCYRKEILFDLCKALEQAEYKDILVYEAMKEIRNIKRRMGRKVSGRCIGTTLLTKGLEFDTVAVLDAHNFKCPKNFYVAITRACRKLMIFTNNNILLPYQQEKTTGLGTGGYVNATMQNLILNEPASFMVFTFDYVCDTINKQNERR